MASKFLMQHPQFKLLITNLVFTAWLLAVAILLQQLATDHPVQWDMTQNGNNSLSDSTVNVLAQMPGKIKLTMFINENQGDMQQAARDFVATYQRYKPDIRLTFIDPEKHPEQARKANIRLNGEMLVDYGGRKERLNQLNEQALTGLLLRMMRTRNQLVRYLDTHGEPSLEGNREHDLGKFGRQLRQNGFRLESLNLAQAPKIPIDTSILILTQPQIDLFPGEIEKLLHYVAGGGNLLWLVDFGPLHGLERMAENLDILLTPGIVIDPAAEEMNLPATWALGANYPPHVITQNFSLTTTFPLARSIDWEESDAWHRIPLAEVAPRGWLSHNIPEDKPYFNSTQDVPGPITIALTLQRNINDREQRIAIVGSSLFLANAYSGNGGNLDLGVSMINWLGHEEIFISPRLRPVKDDTVTLSKTDLGILNGSLLVALPMLLISVGAVLWWRNLRHAQK